MRIHRGFNATVELEHITKTIYGYAGNTNCKRGIVGLSGGKDSTVVAAILARALGPENVIGVMMPSYGFEQPVGPDLSQASEVGKMLGIQLQQIPINGFLDEAINHFAHQRDFMLGNTAARLAWYNFQARIRMAVLYYSAQVNHCRVYGTSNASEILVGYFTKWGDMCCDYGVLGSLLKDEVIELGRALNLPEKYLTVPPSDGLTGKTDEEILGFSYEDIANTYLNNGLHPEVCHRSNEATHKKQVVPAYYVSTVTSKREKALLEGKMLMLMFSEHYDSGEDEEE